MASGQHMCCSELSLLVLRRNSTRHLAPCPAHSTAQRTAHRAAAPVGIARVGCLYTRPFALFQTPSHRMTTIRRAAIRRLGRMFVDLFVCSILRLLGSVSIGRLTLIMEVNSNY
jgi:hypothetical protein